MVQKKKIKSSPSLSSPMKTNYPQPAVEWTAWPALTPPRSTRKKQQGAGEVVKSVTRDEIDRYWRTKRLIEEDHLLAAQKAVARIRAKALKEEDYRRFEESMKAMLDGDDELGGRGVGHDSNKELKIGIKDWWTRSKYAYLNQPAVRSMGPAKSSYVPQLMPSLCHFSPAVRHLRIASPSFGVY